MIVDDLRDVLDGLSDNTEIMVEGVYNIKYKIKDFKLVRTSNTEELFLITGDEQRRNIRKTFKKSI